MKKATIVFLSIALAACSATTTINSPVAGVAVKINEDAPVPLDNDFSKSYTTTSFGNYRFKATTPNGEPMYGALPLKFNGGYLALDILFFAPAMFFNLRGVYPYYEIDPVEGVVRYKQKPEDSWITYKPTGAEEAGARAYFGD